MRCTEPLLLAAGEPSAGATEDVLHLVPERHALQHLLDHRVRIIGALTVQAKTGQHVVADRHGRERVRLLEHHAHAAPHAHGVDIALVDVLLVEQHLTRGARARHDLVHAVQAAHERGFTAARRTDHRGDLLFGDLQADPLQHLGLAEVGAQILGAHLGHERADRTLRPSVAARRRAIPRRANLF